MTSRYRSQTSSKDNQTKVTEDGVRLQLRKTQLNRLPLPSMILGNVRSLRNKVDELQGNVRFLKDFKDCCLMAFTETWLSENDPDSDLLISGFGPKQRGDGENSGWRGVFVRQPKDTVLQ